MDFIPGALIEARDFANNWFPSKVVEVDAEGREVLVHFQNWSSRYDEWISMDSARLRPASNQKSVPSKAGRGKDFKVGEKVMAVWHNNKRYPAQITKILEPGNFEVIFYDGFAMQVKAKQMSRIPKDQADKMEIPFPASIEGEKLLDMEEIGSKEERRKRKKKIEVAELFRYYKKRPSTDNPKDGCSPTPVREEQDETSATIESENSPLPEDPTSTPVPVSFPAEQSNSPTAPTKKKKKKKKGAKTEHRAYVKDHGDIIKLKDDKLPEGWEKRARLKTMGTKAGKWDVIIVGPDGRTFRSKQDIKQYMFIRQFDHDLELFDFRLGPDFYTSRGLPIPKRALTALRPSSIKKEEPVAAVGSTSIVPTPDVSKSTPGPPEPTPVAIAEKTYIKPCAIKVEQSLGGSSSEPETQTIVPEEASGGYRCPLEDCRKLFRRDNLLVMHIKHYHPALLKKLGCKTLRVEDLATARTAFETEEPVKPAPVAQSHSILASILTVPPTPPQQQTSPPVPTPAPRLRQSLDRKTEKESKESKESMMIVAAAASGVATATSGAVVASLVANSPISEDVPNHVISKKSSQSVSSAKSTRRKSEKRPPPVEVPPPPEEILQAESAEAEQAEQLGDADGPEQSAKTEEIVVSTLDDIPGQKELVHCFCGSPEEDGLMIQCELCLCWQHGICLSIETEENVPDPYVCHFCRYPFRERLSRRYTHDQSWLKKGQLPSLKFISGSSSVPADRNLRVAHTLTAAATDLKQLLHSLKVKISIAKNKDHPKLYLWAQPWSKKTVVVETVTVMDTNSSLPQREEDKAFVPNIPLPETPIDATDCRLNLLMHITDTQQEVDARLETLEGLFEECETEEGPLDTSQVAKTLQILLKDVVTLKRMASFSWGS